MKWTKGKPAENGQYWQRTEGTVEPRIVDVQVSNGGMWVLDFRDTEWVSDEKINPNDEWAGPLKPPE